MVALFCILMMVLMMWMMMGGMPGMRGRWSDSRDTRRDDGERNAPSS